MQARLWTYSTLLEFQDASGWPTRVNIAAGVKMESEGCADLEKRLGKLVAVLVTIRNPITASIEATLNGPNSVVLTRKDGSGLPALALRRRQSNSFGVMDSFLTALTGAWSPIIEPQQTVDLRFCFFVRAEIGDSVAVPRLGTFRIQ